MIEQFYPWYWKFYDMAEDEGGGSDDADAEAEADYTGEDEAGEDAPPDEEVLPATSPDEEVIQVLQEAPVVNVSIIPGNKYLQGLSMQYSSLALLDGIFEGNIPSEGARVRTIVTGSPGAKYYLDIVDIDDDEVFKASNVEIQASGKDEFTITFPQSTVVNKYKINLRAGDGTRINASLPTTDPMWTVHQRVNPTITFTKATGTETGVTYSGNDVTFSTVPYGKVNVQTNASQSTSLINRTTSLGAPTKESINLYGQFSYPVTAAKGSSYVYIKNSNFDFTNETIVNKIVQYQVKNSDIVYLDDVTNLYTGMIFDRGFIEKTKTARVNSDTIKLSSVNNIEVGMFLVGYGNTSITNIDVNTNKVTLSANVDIDDRSKINFMRAVGGVLTIKAINTDLKQITLKNKINLDAGTILKFKNDEMKSRKRVTTSGSGSASATLTSFITLREFGSRDVTFTLPTDDIFTLKPNARDQNVRVIKETATEINVMLSDNDDNVANKTPSTVRSPAHGKITGSYGAGDGVITYTPNVGFVGKDSFDFKVSDGTTNSDVKTIFITVHK